MTSRNRRQLPVPIRQRRPEVEQGALVGGKEIHQAEKRLARRPITPARIGAFGAPDALRPGTGEHNPDLGDPGVFYIGDVGWGTREELNVMDEPGLNFGWPKYEGMTHQPGYNNSNYEPATHELAKMDLNQLSLHGPDLPRSPALGPVAAKPNQFPSD